jgi:ATP-dependent RNA helicase HelY
VSVQRHADPGVQLRTFAQRGNRVTKLAELARFAAELSFTLDDFQ